MGGKNDLVNEGFWGINTVKGESYHLNFYARTDQYKGLKDLAWKGQAAQKKENLNN